MKYEVKVNDILGGTELGRPYFFEVLKVTEKTLTLIRIQSQDFLPILFQGRIGFGGPYYSIPYKDKNGYCHNDAPFIVRRKEDKDYVWVAKYNVLCEIYDGKHPLEGYRE